MLFKCLLIERFGKQKQGEAGVSLPAAECGPVGPCSAASSLAPGALGRGCLRQPLAPPRPAPGWSPGSSSEETDAASMRPHPGSAHQNASSPAGPLVLVGSRGAAGPCLFKEGPLHLRGVGDGSLWKSTAPPAPAGSPRSCCAPESAFRGPTGACAVTSHSMAPELPPGGLRVPRGVPRSRARGTWLGLSLARPFLCPHCPAVSVHSAWCLCSWARPLLSPSRHRSPY